MYMYRATAVHGHQVHGGVPLLCRAWYICTWLILGLLWRANSILQFSGPPLSHTQNRVGCAMLDAVSQRLVPAMYLSHVEVLSLAARRTLHSAHCLLRYTSASLPVYICLYLPIALGTEARRRGNFHQHKHSRACHLLTHSLVLLIHTFPVDIQFSFQFHSATDFST
ncbi:hypothetical protein F5Y09DRAFT_247221 [Xylaria sp. FL1042]|nr:hypothetical protein F5Y09DRAFT_247221 [Xylaria sp. FL1042]